MIGVLLGVPVDVLAEVLLGIVVDVLLSVVVEVPADVLVVKLDSVIERLVAEVTGCVVMSDVGFIDSLEVEYDVGCVTV